MKRFQVHSQMEVFADKPVKIHHECELKTWLARHTEKDLGRLAQLTAYLAEQLLLIRPEAFKEIVEAVEPIRETDCRLVPVQPY